MAGYLKISLDELAAIKDAIYRIQEKLLNTENAPDLTDESRQIVKILNAVYDRDSS
jgi:hypothetical protein